MENGENSPAVVTEEKAIETEEADSEAQVEIKEETPSKVSLKKGRKKNNGSIKEPVTPKENQLNAFRIQLRRKKSKNSKLKRYVPVLIFMDY